MRKKWSKTLSLVFLLVMCLLLSAAFAEGPVVTGKEDVPVYIHDDLKEARVRKIVILPFSGESLYKRVVAEEFSYYLQKQPYFEVSGPALSEIELKKRGLAINENLPPLKELLRMGEILGAHAVIAGSVTLEKVGNTSTFDVRTTATLFEVKTGKIMARGEMVVKRTYKIPENVKKSIKISAYQVLSELYKLAGDPREFEILKKKPRETDSEESFNEIFSQP